MSTDKLEDFILNNREEFDDEAPADNLWSKIVSVQKITSIRYHT